MRRHRLVLLCTLPALLALTACGDSTEPPQDSDPRQGSLPASEVQRAQVALEEAGAVPDLVAAADLIGLELITAAPDETTVTSPASLQVVLSMTAEGAEGQTLEELEAAVGATGQDRREAINALTAALEELDGDPAVVQEDELPEGPVVHRASRVVVHHDDTVRQEYVDALAQHYGAVGEATDLTRDEGKAVLDAWVDEHTGGLVPESGIETTPTLRMVLQDALVLAARWESPYEAGLTETDQFSLPGGEQVDVDMMSTGRDRPTAYAEAQGWQAVRLPYAGGRLHADILLPQEGTSPTGMSPELLTQLGQDLETTEPEPVILRMPVADVGSDLDLMDYLEEHVPAALEGGFGGISEADLLIEQAVQQGVLAIDEEGTVAAAVTEFGFGDSSGPAEPPVEFTVDRPYLVRIGDGATGWPLFLAHITDPRPVE